ncbi:MAG: arsenite methyltransferase, partial [Gemmatimonadaceae bacterium]
VSDIVVREGLPDVVKENMALWTGCVAGALEEQEFIDLLHEVGFTDASIEPTRIYTRDDAAALIAGTNLDVALADQVQGKVMSAFVRATKPGADAATARRVAKPKRELATLGAATKAKGGGCGCGSTDCC